MPVFNLELIIEIIATIFGAWGVFLATKQHISNWAVSLLSIVLYIYIFYKSALYGDMALQLVFVVTTIYGWLQWKKLDAQTLTVNKLTIAGWLIVIGLSLVLSVVVFYVLKQTNSTTPITDSITTALSLVATYLLIKKYIENWVLWIVADVIYLYLYCYKELYLTAVLYLLFTLLAIKGFVEWKKVKGTN